MRFYAWLSGLCACAAFTAANAGHAAAAVLCTLIAALYIALSYESELKAWRKRR